jgi:hypothetical protein
VHLWLTPFLSFLEGSNQVAAVNQFRLIQAIADAGMMWLLFASGAGLWVAAGSLGVKACATAFFLGARYGNFFRSLGAGAAAERISWRSEILPMQWRLAAQGILHYLAFSLFTPVMFHYHGAAVAGRMGMTIQIITMAQLMALTWVQTRVPQFGMLAAKRAFGELDHLWRHLTRLTLALAIIGNVLLWLTLLGVDRLAPALAARVLDLLPTTLLLIAFAIQPLSTCQALYLRAYGREPFLLVGVVSSVLIGLSVLVLGMAYGPLGAAAAFLAVNCLFSVPASSYVWARRRAEWQTSQAIS